METGEHQVNREDVPPHWADGSDGGQHPFMLPLVTVPLVTMPIVTMCRPVVQTAAMVVMVLVKFSSMATVNGIPNNTEHYKQYQTLQTIPNILILLTAVTLTNKYLLF